MTIVYLLIAVYINKGTGRTDINIETIPFHKLETCEKVKAKLEPDFKTRYDEVSFSCQKKEVK